MNTLATVSFYPGGLSDGTGAYMTEQKRRFFIAQLCTSALSFVIVRIY